MIRPPSKKKIVQPRTTQTVLVSPEQWSSLCRKLVVVPDKVRDPEKVDSGLRAKVKSIWGLAGRWPLLLHGEAGSGKTCAALTMFDHTGGWFGELKDLCGLHRRSQAGELFAGSDKVGVDYLLSHWKQVPIAVIDEIGMRNPTDFQYEVLKALLDAREDKRLIVCSNLSPDELARIYDDRIMSRLSCGTQYKLTGDRRMQ